MVAEDRLIEPPQTDAERRQHGKNLLADLQAIREAAREDTAIREMDETAPLDYQTARQGYKDG